MTDDDPIAYIEFTDEATTGDVDALATMISERWNYDGDLQLDEGRLVIERVE